MFSIYNSFLLFSFLLIPLRRTGVDDDGNDDGNDEYVNVK